MQRIYVIALGAMMLMLPGSAEQANAPAKAAPKVAPRKIRLTRSGTLLVKAVNDCLELNRAMGTEYFAPVLMTMLDQKRAAWLDKGAVVTVTPPDEGEMLAKDWLKVSGNSAMAKGTFWVPLGSLEGEEPQASGSIAAILIVYKDK